jgi:hypothetical protein
VFWTTQPYAHWNGTWSTLERYMDHTGTVHGHYVHVPFQCDHALMHASGYPWLGQTGDHLFCGLICLLCQSISGASRTSQYLDFTVIWMQYCKITFLHLFHFHNNVVIANIKCTNVKTWKGFSKTPLPKWWNEHFKDVILQVERRGRMVRTSDSQPEGHGFESRQRHGAVSVSRIP